MTSCTPARASGRNRTRCRHPDDEPEWRNGRRSRLKICRGAGPVSVRIRPRAPSLLYPEPKAKDLRWRSCTGDPSVASLAQDRVLSVRIRPRAPSLLYPEPKAKDLRWRSCTGDPSVASLAQDRVLSVRIRSRAPSLLYPEPKAKDLRWRSCTGDPSVASLPQDRVLSVRIRPRAPPCNAEHRPYGSSVLNAT